MEYNVFERLLDVTTQKNLKVSEVNKLSIYGVNNSAMAG